MKSIHTVFGTVILAFAAAPVFAVNFDGNPDLDQSILNDHGNPGFVGTSFSAGKAERGTTDNYGSILLDLRAGQAMSTTGPAEKGQGDNYGSILHDVGSL